MGRWPTRTQLPHPRPWKLLVPYVLLARFVEARAGAGSPLTAWPGTAPHAAYRLTAAMADCTERTGAIVAGDEMSGDWRGYDENDQREILIALGAQTRLALTMVRDKLGTEIEMNWDETERVVCSEALALGRKLVESQTGPWIMPQCAHCREIIANGLCSLQIQAYFLLGFTPAMIAAMCRQSLRQAHTSDT